MKRLNTSLTLAVRKEEGVDFEPVPRTFPEIFVCCTVSAIILNSSFIRIFVWLLYTLRTRGRQPEEPSWSYPPLSAAQKWEGIDFYMFFTFRFLYFRVSGWRSWSWQKVETSFFRISNNFVTIELSVRVFLMTIQLLPLGKAHRFRIFQPKVRWEIRNINVIEAAVNTYHKQDLDLT